MEIVSRDRCGLYAQGVRQGAPQARQVADRFHLLQNFRDRIEEQLSRRHTAEVPALKEAGAKLDADRQSIAKGPREDQDLAAHRQLVKETRRDVRQTRFDHVKSLRDAGRSLISIIRKTGLNWCQLRLKTGLDRNADATSFKSWTQPTRLSISPLRFQQVLVISYF